MVFVYEAVCRQMRVWTGGEGPKHLFKQVVGCARVTRCHWIMLCAYRQILQGNKKHFYDKKWHSLLTQGCKTIKGLFNFFLTMQGVPLPTLFCGSRPCEVQKLMGAQQHHKRGRGELDRWAPRLPGRALSCYRNPWAHVPWQPFLSPDAALLYHPPPDRAACICCEFI